MTEEQLLKVVQDLIGKIAIQISELDLTDEEKVTLLVSNITKYLDNYSGLIDELIPQAVIAQYFGGVDAATAALAGAGLSVPTASAITGAGLVAANFQNDIHLDALQELIDDTLLPLKAAVRTAKLSATTSITQTIEDVNGQLARGIIQGEPRKVLQQEVAKAFSKNGMNSFKTSDDKWLPLDFYSMTVTRTQTRNAAVKGSTNRYQELGQDLVQIVENGDTCEQCARLNGMVVSLTGETKGFPVVGENGVRLPPIHPNCRGGIRPYVLRFKSEEEKRAAYERNAKYHPEKDPRTPAQKAEYEREQKKRRQANVEKKQFAQWKAILGDKNFKSIGAFRTAKRTNSKRYRELKAEMAQMGQAQNGMPK